MAQNKSTRKQKSLQATGLTVDKYFTTGQGDAYACFQYEQRSSVIGNTKGDVVFENKHVEVPADWSQVATDILAQKYFRRTGVPQPDGSKGGETSIRQVVPPFS